jgi:hypothetical protein
MKKPNPQGQWPKGSKWKTSSLDLDREIFKKRKKKEFLKKLMTNFVCGIVANLIRNCRF